MALDRVFDILEYVAERHDVRIGQVCEELNLPRPTAHRLLSQLVRRGYLSHDQVSHLYQAGPSLVAIGASAAYGSVVYHAESVLAKLREATGETANVGLLRGDRIVYAGTLDGSLLPRMSVVVGEEVPPHAAAIGKAVLAHIKEPDRTRLLGREPYRRFTHRTKWSRRQVEAELKLTAGRGYAVDNEEVTADAVCIGSVILGQRGEPVGALSLSATVARFRRESWDGLGALVAESCTHLSGLLAAASVAPKRMNGEKSAL